MVSRACERLTPFGTQRTNAAWYAGWNNRKDPLSKILNLDRVWEERGMARKRKMQDVITGRHGDSLLSCPPAERGSPQSRCSKWINNQLWKH